MTHDYTYKVVLIGDSSVGKSSLLRRFADDSFQQSYLATIGVDFKFKTLEISGESAKLQIWDTAGQQRFRTITSAYYKNAQGIIIVFDLQHIKTFQNVQQFWIDEVKKYAEKDVQILVIGNKMDCKENITVTQQVLAKFQLGQGVSCINVSAKTGEGVKQAFQLLTKNCIKRYGKTNEQSKQKNRVIDDIRKKKADFKLKTGQTKEKTQKKCC